MVDSKSTNNQQLKSTETVRQIVDFTSWLTVD